MEEWDKATAVAYQLSKLGVVEQAQGIAAALRAARAAGEKAADDRWTQALSGVSRPDVRPEEAFVAAKEVAAFDRGKAEGRRDGLRLGLREALSMFEKMHPAAFSSWLRAMAEEG